MNKTKIKKSMGCDWGDIFVISSGILFLMCLLISGLLVVGIGIPFIHVPQVPSLKDKITISLSFATAFFAIMSFSVNSNSTFKKNKLDIYLMRSKHFDSQFLKFKNMDDYNGHYDFLANIVKQMAFLYDTKYKTEKPILAITELSDKQAEFYNSFKNERISFNAIESSFREELSKKINIKKEISQLFLEVRVDISAYNLLIKGYGLKMNTESQRQFELIRFNSDVFAEYYSRPDKYQTINYQIILEMWQTMLINQKFGELAFHIVQSSGMLIKFPKDFSIRAVEKNDVNYIFDHIKENKKILDFMLKI